MRSARRRTAICAAILVITASTVAVTAAQPTASLQPGFAKALQLVQQAEAAGATPSELAPIISLLNQALAFNQQALQMTSPQDAQKRQQLLTQVDQMLSQVDTAAAHLQTVAAQRTQLQTILTYVSGVIAALIGTIAYAYGVSFWRRYKIKRIFQMRVSAK